MSFWSEARESGFETVCAVDFEGGERTGVVEFGLVFFGAEGIRETRTGLCLPRGSVPGRETETHGLDARALAGSAPFSDHWELFRDTRRAGPLLAHSAQVEDRFLRKQWPTPGNVRDWAQPAGECIGWGPWLDSCALVRAVAPGSSAALRPIVEGWGMAGKLDDLAARHCPAGRRRWHAALYDALASALVFLRLVEARPDWSLRRLFRLSAGLGEANEQSEMF